MTKALVKRATLEDVEEVIRNIRDADRIELEAARGIPYDEVLRASFRECDEMWAGFADGELIGVFGVHVLCYLSGLGVPYMISTKSIENNKVTFARHCKRVFSLMAGTCNRLVNYVDDRNTTAIYWLKWLGFHVHDPVPFGAMGLPFRKFEMEIDHV